MTTAVNLPELIIALSRDKVRVHLLHQPETGRLSWQSAFPIRGAFLEEQITHALDSALTQNPSLIDQFDNVEVVMLDSPNVSFPPFYLEEEAWVDIAARYLRLRVGDTLTVDSGPRDTMIAYTLPTETFYVLREYYANAGHLHMASVIWSNLMHRQEGTSPEGTRLYFNLNGNTLIALAETESKLIFSRCFTVHEEGDLLYYMMACSRMLGAQENWYVSIMHETPLFEIPQVPSFTIHHRVELPELHTLIAQHRLCES